MRKNKKMVFQGLPGGSKEKLKQRVKSFYDMLASVYGADKLILKAIKLEALSLMRSKQIEKRVLGLQKIIFEDPTIEKVPSLLEVSSIMEQLEEQAAEFLAQRTLEESLEQKISRKLQEKHEEYILEVKKQLLKEEGGPENPQTLKKYAWVEKMHATALSSSAMEFLRPSSLEEIVGQEKGIRALMSKLASSFPQHVIIYGPPGIGKTAAARLALEAAKKMPHTPFSREAPFVEIDATTLRWDPRETTNPLLGSVHDPIYQGARKDLSEGGIPEPKPGLVTDAHTGVLFIDEIGEMDPYLQSKLLKVLEDKKVYFDSAYYDPSDPQIPKYIRKLFEEGAPADFVLIGATTRSPDNISPALRSRCSAVYFEPLSPEHIKEIINNASRKLNVQISQEAAELISRNTCEGRKGVNLLADAYGLARYIKYLGNPAQQVEENEKIFISEDLVKEVIQSNRLVPAILPETSIPQIGRVYGLAASGYLGSVLEIEVVSFPSAEAGKGKIRFNEAAGSMARDSVYNAASVLRKLTGMDIGAFDLHFNVVGGGNIDGPSAGAALFLALYSTLMQVPLRQDIAVSGELSLHGKVKPVGGLFEKLYGARVAGIKSVCLPVENVCELPSTLQDMDVFYVNSVEDLLSRMLVRECSG